MVYALNVFNVIDGGEHHYKRYAVNAGRLLLRVGGSVAVAGHRPLQKLEGDLVRSYFMIVQFPDERNFSTFLSLMELEGMHHARRSITSDYIWTLYEPWDLTRWVNE